MQALQMIRPSAGCSASGTQSSFPSAQAPGRLRGRKSENPKGRGTQELKASREIVGRDEGLEERCQPQRAPKDLEQRPQSRAGESSLSYSRTPSYFRDGRGWPQPRQATTVVIFSWIQFYLVWLGAGVGGVGWVGKQLQGKIILEITAGKTIPASHLYTQEHLTNKKL